MFFVTVAGLLQPIVASKCHGCSGYLNHHLKSLAVWWTKLVVLPIDSGKYERIPISGSDAIHP